jgi:uncharacterized protein YqjF (DUF2071 family)
MLTADWDRTLMIHYEVAPEKLQPFVPFPLDVRDGKAYVSLVAFTMRGLRPKSGGVLTALPFKPITTYELLNVRTYVRHAGVSGIYFLAEWVQNLLSVPLGRLAFGLPYRWGNIGYQHDHEHGVLHGEVRARSGGGALRYRAKMVTSVFSPCVCGSSSEWLMERYTALTAWRGWKRRFRVQHDPWLQCAVDAAVLDQSLLSLTGDWARYARLMGANYSPGLQKVSMTPPTPAPTLSAPS